MLNSLQGKLGKKRGIGFYPYIEKELYEKEMHTDPGNPVQHSLHSFSTDTTRQFYGGGGFSQY
jgi:hypothetical protein